ncbi:hypothetical protein [Mesonia sp.]|uniref:hypothetical protein n=1 Tax=Mesonia sp. TaxID=1960830 RepID=UPI003F9AA237
MLDNLTNKKINQTLSDFQQKYSFILITLEEEHKQIKNVLNKSTKKWKEINFEFNDFKRKQDSLINDVNEKLHEVKIINSQAAKNLQFISQFDRKLNNLQISLEKEQKKFEITTDEIQKKLKVIDSDSSIQIKNLRNDIDSQFRSLLVENKNLSDKIRKGRKMSHINLIITLISFLILVSYIVYEKF